MTRVCIHIAHIRAYGDLRSLPIFVFESVGAASSSMVEPTRGSVHAATPHTVEVYLCKIAALAHSTARESPPQGHIQTQHRP